MINEGCGIPDCVNNWKWKFIGTFEINDEIRPELCLCQDHYELFIEQAPIEMLKTLMENMPES